MVCGGGGDCGSGGGGGGNGSGGVMLDSKAWVLAGL